MLYVVPCLNTYDFCVGMMRGVYGYMDMMSEWRGLWSTHVLPILIDLNNTGLVVYSIIS